MNSSEFFSKIQAELKNSPKLIDKKSTFNFQICYKLFILFLMVQMELSSNIPVTSVIITLNSDWLSIDNYKNITGK